MTTYTTPHFANGLPNRNVSSGLDKETNVNTRPVRVEPVLDAESVRMAEVAAARTVEWQPGASSGVPKAAIGAFGAALVGGIALAVIMLSPDTVTKPAAPSTVATSSQASPAVPAATPPSADSMANTLDNQPTAAGNPAPQASTDAATAAQAQAQPAAPAPVAATPVIPATAAPVAPVLHAPRHVAASPVHQQAMPEPAPVLPPPAEQPAPAMQQSQPAPQSSTVSPAPQPMPPAPDSGSTPAPTPAPGGND